LKEKYGDESDLEEG